MADASCIYPGSARLLRAVSVSVLNKLVTSGVQVVMSGNKENAKLYKRHVNGLPGSMKVETFKQLQQRIPERIIEKAVHGMLPKGRLGRRIKLNLKVCAPFWSSSRSWRSDQNNFLWSTESLFLASLASQWSLLDCCCEDMRISI